MLIHDLAKDTIVDLVSQSPGTIGYDYLCFFFGHCFDRIEMETIIEDLINEHLIKYDNNGNYRLGNNWLNNQMKGNDND